MYAAQRSESTRRRRRFVRRRVVHHFALENDAEKAFAEHFEQIEIFRIDFPFVGRLGRIEAGSEMRRMIGGQFELMNAFLVLLLLATDAQDGDDDDDDDDDDENDDNWNDIGHDRLLRFERS